MSQTFAIFCAVFLAELGDKTQLATLLFAASGEQRPIVVFLAASAALAASTGLAVLLGGAAGKHLAAAPLKLVAGVGFIAIGAWMVAGHFAKA